MAKTRRHKWTIFAPRGTKIVGAEVCGNGRRINIFSNPQATDFFASYNNQDKDFWKYPGEGIVPEDGFRSCPGSEHPMEGLIPEDGFYSCPDSEHPMEGLRTVNYI